MASECDASLGLSGGQVPLSPRAAIPGGVDLARSLEPVTPNAATVATATGFAAAVRLVARHRGGIVHTEFGPPADDFGLGEIDERGVDFDLASLYPHLGPKVREPFEGSHEGWPAVGIARVVDSVDADEQMARGKRLRPRGGE